MPEKSNAGEAGPATPVQVPLEPLAGPRGDDRWLEAVKSQHEAAKDIAKTYAWAGVLKAAVLPASLAAVFICAMALDMPLPWPLALAALLGKVPGH